MRAHNENVTLCSLRTHCGAHVPSINFCKRICVYTSCHLHIAYTYTHLDLGEGILRVGNTRAQAHTHLVANK